MMMMMMMFACKITQKVITDFDNNSLTCSDCRQSISEARPNTSLMLSKSSSKLQAVFRKATDVSELLTETEYARPAAKHRTS